MIHSEANEHTKKKELKHVAYLMSRFPKISETFILYEILELERLGMQVSVFPLVQQHEQVMHAEARAVVERASYSTLVSQQVLAAQFFWLRKRPQAYLRAWWHAIRGNISSPKFLLRAVAVVPQAAWFARAMQAAGVEHVHAHWATHPALAAYVVQQLTELPYSFTAHAHDIYVERPMLEEKMRHASFVVTISAYNRRLLKQWYGAVADKTVIIHCGVDPDVFQPRDQARRNAVFTILCVASLQDYKGHPYLVEACRQLKDQGVAFQCLLVGEGEDRPHIEALIAEHGLQAEVRLLGQQSRDRVSVLAAEADVMVLPSVTTSSGKQEGIPVALMEALATELPVVATAISGIPELIEDEQTGLLVPERNAAALAAALLRLYHAPALGQRLGRAGREKVLREFNLRVNTAALYTLLERDWREPVTALGTSLLLDEARAE
jgi:glycosyltransferase involved in cell wall biosynthesis